MEFVINQVQSILSRYYKNGIMSEISIKDTLNLMIQKEKIANQIANIQVAHTKNDGHKNYISEMQLRTTKKNIMICVVIFFVALLGFKLFSIALPSLFAFIFTLICFGSMENKTRNLELEKAFNDEEAFIEHSFNNAKDEIAMLKQNMKVIDKMIKEGSVVPTNLQTKSGLVELMSYREKGFAKSDKEAITRFINRNFS